MLNVKIYYLQRKVLASEIKLKLYKVDILFWNLSFYYCWCLDAFLTQLYQDIDTPKHERSVCCDDTIFYFHSVKTKKVKKKGQFRSPFVPIVLYFLCLCLACRAHSGV